MTLLFHKMHSLGNDFIVLESLTEPMPLDPIWIPQLANRHRGIGFDQCLLITPPRTTDADFGYQIFNADGSQVYQCGNGLRCVAACVHHFQFSSKKKLRWQTLQNQILLSEYHTDDTIWTALKPPTDLRLQQVMHFHGTEFVFHALDVGNPHAIFWEGYSWDEHTQEKLVHELNHSVLFPAGVNVSFAQIRNECTVELKVYERGAGLTLACGSAAAALVACGNALNVLQSTTTVIQKGGSLRVRHKHLEEPIEVVGPAHYIYAGKMDINKLKELTR